MTAGTLRSVGQLVEAGLIPADQAAALSPVADRYAIAVPPLIARQIKHAGPDSPLARQYLPTPGETASLPLDMADPIGDDAHSPVPGIVHRYTDRALLKLVHACPVYCRFCFRREMVGPGGDALTGDDLDIALGYIADHPELREIILTGGDPLIASPRRLRDLFDRLADIPHLQTIRIHTRVPVTVPERVTDDLVKTLSGSRLPIWVALHINHEDELFTETSAVINKLALAGIPLLSQTVLLRGVNDCADSLISLFEHLGRLRVRPYYLHHPDRAPGTSRFRLTVQQGLDLYNGLKGQISGWLLPRYVLDLPGGVAKIALDSHAVRQNNPGQWHITDPSGGTHIYHDDHQAPLKKSA
ncbi:MAG: lysine-2,3-aminomutase-like protein [Alphaproteobacteria bacterium]